MGIANRILAGCAAIAALVGPSANADTINWITTTGGSYATAANWSPATVPTTTSDVVFNLNNTYTVNFPTATDSTNHSALIDRGNVTFNLGGAARTYTVNSPDTAEGLVVGNSNTATLTVANGTLSNLHSSQVGYLAGSHGTLNILSGAAVTADSLLIGGESGATGGVVVNGQGTPGSAALNMGLLRVGALGTGTLDILNGGVVTVCCEAYIGMLDPGASGTVTVDGVGSQLTATGTAINVGAQGLGTLVISNGGVVTSGQLGTTAGVIGSNNNNSGVGVVTVNGPGSRWDMVSKLWVGGSGSGSLDITGGGVVTSTSGELARRAGSSAAVTVGGAGSAWSLASNLDVGGRRASLPSNSNICRPPLIFPDCTDGAGGNASLTINAGGTISAGGLLRIWSPGTVNLNGGTLDVGSLTNSGVFTFTSGTLDIDNLTFGAGGPLGSAFTVSAGKTLVVDGTTTLATGGSLTVSGGAFSSGSTTLNGGSLTADSLGGLGTIAFNAGTVNTGSLTFGAGGPLGSNYSLGTGRNLNVTNATTIDLGSTLTINGGNFTTGSLVKNGTFQFLSGSMDLGSTPLTLGAGDTFNLGAGSSFVNTGTLSIAPGSSFVINGGTFSAGKVQLTGGTFNFTSGQLNLTDSGITIDVGGLLGNNVTLDANRQVSVSGNANVVSGSTLNLNGGNLAVGGILGIQAGGTVNGQGTFSGGSLVVLGNLNLTGNSDILSSIVAIGDQFSAGGPGLISVADGTTTHFYGDVYANGTGINVGAGGEAIYDGYLGGSGVLGGAGTHTAGGTVSPGNSPGLLTVENDFVFENSATFLVEINGLTRGTDPGYDAMDVGGDAWLAGILDVDLLNGFAPNEGDSFDILMALVLHGTFDSTLFPTLGNDLHWELQYLLNPTGIDTLRLTAQATVPVPAAVWLFGSGLGVLTLLRRRTAPARVTLH